jgi:hypothetical protein
MKNSMLGQQWPTEPGDTAEVELALQTLFRAHDFAQDLNLDPLEFAVGIAELERIGVSPNTLRWLVCTGRARHLIESTRWNSERRSFREGRNLCFVGQSCIALRGKAIRPAQRSVAGAASADEAGDRRQVETPKWDAARRTLCLGSRVVKRFKHLASNQELVLAAFEAQRWAPPRIQDPLPLDGVCNPKRRLHDTIKKLNQGQVHRLIHFFGDGSSRAICWELVR